MNIIIVGDGKVGAALATQMSAEGHDVTIIDSNPQVLSESAERLDIMAVIGNGASMATLRSAGVEKADVLIAATSRDELNLLCCLTAKKLGVGRTIARIRNPEYAEQLVEMQEELERWGDTPRMGQYQGRPLELGQMDGQNGQRGVKV